MRLLPTVLIAAVAGLGLADAASAQQSANNNECSGAIPITDGLTSGDTSGATTSNPTGSCGNMQSDIWYSYVAPGPGTLTVTTCNGGGTAGYDAFMAAFSGTCGSLTQVACNDDTCSLSPELTFQVTTGTTYYIAVGGYNTNQGSFTISVSCNNCAVPSAQVPRLGTPPNPGAFRRGVTSGPVIGNTWDPVIDHTNFVPDALFDFMIITANPANGNFGEPSGVLLCDPFQPYLKVLMTAPGVPFNVPLPDLPSIVGVEVCTQGGSIDSNYQAIFANALDLVVGEI